MGRLHDDGYGSYDDRGDWGGYWGKHGPELLEHRLGHYSSEQRMVFGATTMRINIDMLGPNTEGAGVPDPWVARMQQMPATVVSGTLDGPLDWPDVTIERGDAAEVVSRLKEESDVPLRSHGSILLNRALLAAGLVDQLQVTIFPVVSGQTGADPLFAGAADRSRAPRVSDVGRPHQGADLPPHVAPWLKDRLELRAGNPTRAPTGPALTRCE